MTVPVPKPRLWPRNAVGPNGNMARFACMGDVPAGWRLERPLPDGPPVGPPTVASEAPPVEKKNKGGRPRKIPEDL